jgi:hypothetical protein
MEIALKTNSVIVNNVLHRVNSATKNLNDSNTACDRNSVDNRRLIQLLHLHSKGAVLA